MRKEVIILRKTGWKEAGGAQRKYKVYISISFLKNLENEISYMTYG
jgi:hypothetical protein